MQSFPAIALSMLALGSLLGCSSNSADSAASDPGPAPAGCGTITKDADGFFKRSTSLGDYYGYVPASYTGQPTRLLVGLHGCGDHAQNYASWAVNPSGSRATQDYIGIAVDGASADGSCWDTNADAAKVLAAIDDVSTCFYVHKHEVVLSGYSSGGILGYSVALSNAARFAGLLILNSGLYSTGKEDMLLAGAAWKLNITHRAHLQDMSFPIDMVRADWMKIEAAQFPLVTNEAAGTHDATGDDWVWLLPHMETWVSP